MQSRTTQVTGEYAKEREVKIKMQERARGKRQNDDKAKT